MKFTTKGNLFGQPVNVHWRFINKLQGQVEFALIFSMEFNEPIGIWATDHFYFSTRYTKRKVGYTRISEIMSSDFDPYNVEDWNEFWDYWASQGGYSFSISGPFITRTKETPTEFCIRATKDLKKFVEDFVNGDSPSLEE